MHCPCDGDWKIGFCLRRHLVPVIAYPRSSHQPMNCRRCCSDRPANIISVWRLTNERARLIGRQECGVQSVTRADLGGRVTSRLPGSVGVKVRRNGVARPPSKSPFESRVLLPRYSRNGTRQTDLY